MTQIQTNRNQTARFFSLVKLFQENWRLGIDLHSINTSNKIILTITMLFSVIQIYILSQSANIYEGNAFGDYDPQYAYLYSAASLANLESPYLYHHPGIVLQFLLVFLLRAYQVVYYTIFLEWKFIDYFLITNPEGILFLASICLVTINATAIFVLCRYIYSMTFSLLTTILTFFLYIFSLQSQILRIAQVNNESLSISLCLFLFSLVLYTYKYNDCARRVRNGILAGFVCALITLSKVTFYPILLLSIIFISDRLRRIPFISAFIISILVFSVFSIGDYLKMVSWFWKIALHSGTYGGGEATVFDLQRVKIGLEEIINSYKITLYLIILTFIFSLIIYIFKYEFFATKFISRNNLKLAFILSIAGLLNMLMVLKHYGDHYYIPSLLSQFFILIIFIIELYKSEKLVFLKGKMIRSCLMLSIAIIYFSVQRPHFNHESSRIYIADELEIVERAFNSILWVTTYPVPTKLQAIAFGMNLSRFKFNPDIVEDALGQPLINFNRWSKQYRVNGRNISDEDLLDILKRLERTVLFHIPSGIKNEEYRFDLINIDIFSDGSRVARMVIE